MFNNVVASQKTGENVNKQRVEMSIYRVGDKCTFDRTARPEIIFSLSKTY